MLHLRNKLLTIIDAQQMMSFELELQQELSSSWDGRPWPQ